MYRGKNMHTFGALFCMVNMLWQTPQPPIPLLPEEPKGSIILENATIADAVLQMGKKFNVNIISDAYANDGPLVKTTMENIPIVTAIGQIAALYGRDVFFVNRTYILRSRSVLVSLGHERSAFKDGIHWTNEGSLTIKRLGTSIPYPPAKLTRSRQAKDAKPLRLPASLLSFEIRNAPLNKVMRKFNEESAWLSAVEPDLGSRRITAYITKAPPAQFLDSLSKLLNATQRLTLAQTDDQKQLEQALLGNLSERERLSHILADKLSDLLSKEQKQQRAKGEQVPIALKDMPPELQAMALEYMRQAIQDMPPPPLNIDMKRLMEGAIRFLPPPSNCLGVDAFMLDGGQIHF